MDVFGKSGDDGEVAAEGIVDLLRRIEPLKHLLRAGWVDREVGQPESVAAHSWRLAVMSWLVADQAGLDSTRAMHLALVHDIAESVTGDSTPFDLLGSTPAERRALATSPPERDQWRSDAQRRTKVTAERLAIEQILDGAPARLAEAVRSAWEEYESGSSPEARLVQQLDKLEAFLQGCEYAADGRLADTATLNSFRVDNNALIHDRAPQQMLRAIELWCDRERAAGRSPARLEPPSEHH